MTFPLHLPISSTSACIHSHGGSLFSPWSSKILSTSYRLSASGLRICSIYIVHIFKVKHNYIWFQNRALYHCSGTEVWMVSISMSIKRRNEKEANCSTIYAASFLLVCWHTSLSFLITWRKGRTRNFQLSELTLSVPVIAKFCKCYSNANRLTPTFRRCWIVHVSVAF